MISRQAKKCLLNMTLFLMDVFLPIFPRWTYSLQKKWILKITINGQAFLYNLSRIKVTRTGRM